MTRSISAWPGEKGQRDEVDGYGGVEGHLVPVDGGGDFVPGLEEGCTLFAVSLRVPGRGEAGTHRTRQPVAAGVSCIVWGASEGAREAHLPVVRALTR